jgi:pimeloyl-ACP methyl ester carboxylesterase
MDELTTGVTEASHLIGAEHRLVGISARPRGGADPALPTVVFLNSGIIHRVGPNRLYVRLARALAREGALVYRFDFSGIGDSGNPSYAGGAHRSEVESREVETALDWIRDQEGADRFVLVGLCSGGDNAFLGIVRERRVVGAVLLDPFAFRTTGYFLRYYGPRLFNPAVWWRVLTGRSPFLRGFLSHLRRRLRAEKTSEGTPGEPPPRDLTRPARDEMRRQLAEVVERSGRLLYVFTGGLQERYYYRNQFYDAFPGMDFRGLVDFEYYPDSDHTFSRKDLQERLEGRVVEWFRVCFRIDSSPTSLVPTSHPASSELSSLPAEGR